MFEVGKKYKIYLKNNFNYEVFITEVDAFFIKGIDKKQNTVIINKLEINDCTLME